METVSPRIARLQKLQAEAKHGTPDTASDAVQATAAGHVVYSAQRSVTKRSEITTRIVNKHHVVKDGKLPADVSYIGRGSALGNPYPIDVAKGDTREKVIMKFALDAARDPALYQKLLGMRAGRLGCFCSPKPCHGDVIGFVAEGIEPDPVKAAERLLGQDRFGRPTGKPGQTLAQYQASLPE